MPSGAVRGSALLAVVILASTKPLAAQALGPPLPCWRAERPAQTGRPVSLADVRILLHSPVESPRHSHTRTGLLIGGLVGAAATGAFLAAFCSDPDTRCGANEVARAVIIIALPPTVLGAAIGSLIRTKT